MMLQIGSNTGDRIARLSLCKILGVSFDLVMCGHGYGNILGRPLSITEPALAIYEDEEVERIEQPRECEFFVSNPLRGNVKLKSTSRTSEDSGALQF